MKITIVRIMSNKVEEYDLMSKGVLTTQDNVIEKLYKTLDLMKLLASEGVKFNQSFAVPKGLETTVKGTKTVADNTNKLVATEKELIKQQDLLVKSEAKRIASMSSTSKEIIKSQLERKKNIAAIKEEITGTKAAAAAAKAGSAATKVAAAAAKEAVLIAKNKAKAITESAAAAQKAVIAEEKYNAAIQKEKDAKSKLFQISKQTIEQKRQLATAQARETTSKSKLNKEIIKSRLETQKNNTEVKKQIQLDETVKGSLNRLEKELSKNITKYKNLTAAERANKKVGGQLLTNIQKQDTAVKKLNSSLGRAQGNVGNYGSAMKNVGKQMVSALGVVGGVTALVSIMKSATKVVMDFSSAQSELGALSGKTTEELKGLTDQALLLGSTTEFTATQATKAQTELVKLGLSVEQIGDSTPEILKFASATGAELPAAAKTAAVAMKAFGLESSEMGRITSALAVATTKSALSFADYDTILSTLGPVSKAYGFSLEETIDLTGQLKNAGFDASSAATATRKIMLNLADSNGALAQSLGRPIKNLDDLGVGLQELKDKGVDLGEALELTDVKSVAAFSTFLAGAGSVGELRDSITGANDQLDLMVEKRLDNLRGDTVKLGSAWEGFLLSVESGDGIFSKISRTIVQFLSKLLGGLTSLMKYKNVISTIISVTVTYIAALKAQVLWAKKDIAIKAAQNLALKIQSALTGKQTTATVGATVAQKGLNKAMSANLFAAIATAIIFAVQALVKWNKGLVKARIDTKELTSDIAKESQETNNLFEVLKKTEVGSKEYNDTKAKLNELYPTLLKHYDLESGSLEEIEAAQRAANNEAVKSVALKQKQADIQDVAEKANEKFAKSTEKLLKLAKNPEQKGALASIIGDVSNQIKAGSMSVDEGSKKIAEFLDIPEKYGRNTSSGFAKITASLTQIEKQSSKLNEATAEIDTFYTALTGNVIDYNSAFGAIDASKTLEQLDSYLNSSDAKIKEEAEKRKVLIDELNVAKPIVDEAKSKAELEDYLKSTNALVKDYAEQRSAQLDLAEFSKSGDDESSEKIIEGIKKAQAKIKVLKPITVDDIVDFDEAFEFSEPDTQEAQAAYDLFWQEQILKAKQAKGLFSDNADERLAAEEELADKLLSLQRQEIQAEIDNGYLSATEQIEAKMQLIDIDQQIHNQKMSDMDAEIEKRKEVTAKSIELVGQSADALGGIYDAQQARVDAAYEFQVARTEEGSEARIAAEAKYDVESRKIARKQAVLQKAQSLFNIGISTAQAIMGIWAQFPKVDFGVTAGIMTGVVAGIGAAQAAAILSTPLPAFKDGGTVLEDTLARVSEDGSELAILPGGGMFMTPESESIMHLPKGTEIKPNADPMTQRLLARQAYSSANVEMGKTNKILEQIRDSKPETIENGYRYVNRRGVKGRYKV